MKKIAYIAVIVLSILSLAAPAFSKPVIDNGTYLTDAKLLKYINRTVLKGEVNWSVTLVPTNNPDVVAAVAHYGGYPGTTYLYICSRTLKSPGAAP
ncbi:MAG: hypothetical protein V1682_06830, partial [Candidatus Omnitrophota bacterium]